MVGSKMCWTRRTTRGTTPINTGLLLCTSRLKGPLLGSEETYYCSIVHSH